MKKTVTKLIVAVLSLSVVITTAFAGGQREPDVPTIRLYAPSWGLDHATEMIERYSIVNPDVRVELLEGPSDWSGHVQRSSLWIRTNYPGVDLLYQDDGFAIDGVDAGAWVDLAPHLSDTISDLDDLQKQFMAAHGGFYRAPWYSGMSYMFYRKDLFEEAGLNIPNTWEELLATARELTVDTTGDGEIDQWGYITQGGIGEMYNNFTEFFLQAGGDQWNVAPGGEPTRAAVNALEYMKELYQAAAPPDQISIDYDQGRALFLDGRVAMIRDWANTGSLAAEQGLQDVVGVMPFPAGEAGPWGIGHAWGIVVNRHGTGYQNHPEEVIDFVRFMMQPENHEITASIEGPALVSVLNNTEVMARLEQQNVAISQFDELVAYRAVRMFPPGRGVEYHDGIGEIVQEFIAGEIDARAAAVAIQRHIDPLIADFR